jgi:hypothetical protein
VVSFPLVSPLKPCIHLSSPPYVPQLLLLIIVVVVVVVDWDMLSTQRIPESRGSQFNNHLLLAELHAVTWQRDICVAQKFVFLSVHWGVTFYKVTNKMHTCKGVYLHVVYSNMFRSLLWPSTGCFLTVVLRTPCRWSQQRPKHVAVNNM